MQAFTTLTAVAIPIDMVNVDTDQIIRCDTAPSFGDIHFPHAKKNGLHPRRLPKQDCAALRKQLNEKPGAEITIDLAAQKVTGPDGKSYSFDIDPFAKHRMLKGLDDIDMTMEYEKEFDAFEKRYKKEASWLFAE